MSCCDNCCDESAGCGGNPFKGLISSCVKTLFKQAIDSLLCDSALALPCRFVYGVTKFELCVNCIYDTVGKKSSNRYLTGGPFPFHGVCPMCNGQGTHPVQTTEDISLIILWSYKQFIDIGIPINIPQGIVQSISRITSLPVIKKADYIIVDTTIEGYGTNRYKRYGEPVPIGFGESTYIICYWERI